MQLSFTGRRDVLVDSRNTGIGPSGLSGLSTADVGLALPLLQE